VAGFPQAGEQKLSFKTGGIIRKIFVSEGQSVYRGNILASLDLSEIQSQVNQAREALEKAERDYDRLVNLYNDSVATLEQLQNTKTMLQISRSNYDIAAFNLRPFKHCCSFRWKDPEKKLWRKMKWPDPDILSFCLVQRRVNWIVRINVTDRDRVRLHTGDYSGNKTGCFPGRKFSGRDIRAGQRC